MAKLTWELKVKISVEKSWVADGFQATPEYIQEVLEDNLLTFAAYDEKSVKVTTLKAPEISKIRKLQGYSK